MQSEEIEKSINKARSRGYSQHHGGGPQLRRKREPTYPLSWYRSSPTYARRWICPLSWRGSSPTHARADGRSKPPPQKRSRSGPDHHLLRSISAPSVQQSGKPLTASLSPFPQVKTQPTFVWCARAFRSG